MITLVKEGIFLQNGQRTTSPMPAGAARRNTIAYQVLSSHNASVDMTRLELWFDSLAAHDMAYVDIIQTAAASGMQAFPVPFVLTNCHNSLCATGGTLHADNHRFGFSAAEKFGGIYVPANMAVLHHYNREMMAGCGRMILAADAHTRYGALGTMGVSGSDDALVRQLLGRTVNLPMPEVLAVRLSGKLCPGVGPHDVALAIIGAVYQNGFAQDKVLEFTGEGIRGLPVEYRNSIDVMMAETGCWSTIWETDERVREYLEIHNRADAYRPLEALGTAYYDGVIDVNLDTLEPMISLPFAPGNTYTVASFLQNAGDILREVERACELLYPGRGVTPNLTGKVRDGAVYVDQGIVAGCAGGTYDNLCEMAEILRGHTVGNGPYALSVFPGSQPVYLEMLRKGIAGQILRAGAMLRECACGPCIGACDIPESGALSIRHVTRNFPMREGSLPSEGQLSCVALMDARSIAATSVNGGRLTSALDTKLWEAVPKFTFERTLYRASVYDGFGKPVPETPLVRGPGIHALPDCSPLGANLLLQICREPAEAALPDAAEMDALPPDVQEAASVGAALVSCEAPVLSQAASHLRGQGIVAVVAQAYPVADLRETLLHWGIVPFMTDSAPAPGEMLYVPNVRRAIEEGWEAIPGVVHGDVPRDITLAIGSLSKEQRAILLDGGLINHYRA